MKICGSWFGSLRQVEPSAGVAGELLQRASHHVMAHADAHGRDGDLLALRAGRPRPPGGEGSPSLMMIMCRWAASVGHQGRQGHLDAGVEVGHVAHDDLVDGRLDAFLVLASFSGTSQFGWPIPGS